MTYRILIIPILIAVILNPIVMDSLDVANNSSSTLKYSIRVEFRDYHVNYNGRDTVLDGVVDGVLSVKYVFSGGNVTVYTKYIDYRLYGFNDPSAREFIVNSVHSGSRRIFSIYEKPMDRSESFITSGVIKYYVYPGNLPVDPWIRQRVRYVVLSGNRSIVIEEDRYYRYIPDNGFISECYINARVYSGGYSEEYIFRLKILPGNDPSYMVYRWDIDLLVIALASIISIIAYSLYGGSSKASSTPIPTKPRLTDLDG